MTPVGSAVSAPRPFPGLRPFEYTDHEFFFGRQEQIFGLYRLIDSSRFVAVIGSSGSGKSSLVRAGLLPYLDEETAGREGGEDDRAWLWRIMTPGDAPLDRLVDVLTGLSKDDDSSVRERIGYHIRRSSFGMADALREIPALKGKTLFLVVDQFEELFRFTGSGARRGAKRQNEERARDAATHFVQILLEIDRDPDIDMHVLITMRSDFIGDCARYHGLPEAVSGTQFLVPSLTRSQLEDVIREPIEAAGATIEPALVERLIIDSGDEMDQLPVLQHCLQRVWAKVGANRATPDGAPTPSTLDPVAGTENPQRARNLSVEDYISVGGLADALSKHANDILTDLTAFGLAVEQTFRALAELDKEGRAIRRALPFQQLLDEAGVPEGDLRRVLDRFRADDCCFLMPSVSAVPELAAGTRIDVGHETLLRRWKRVSGDADLSDVDDESDTARGWLRAEAREGEHYRSMLDWLDKDRRGGEGLPLDLVEEKWGWWKARPRTSAWAERYGGRFSDVLTLLEKGERALRAAAQRKLWSRVVAGIGVLIVFSLVGSAVFSRLRGDRILALLAESQNNLSEHILTAHNDGLISIKGALNLLDAEEKNIDNYKSLPETKALQDQLHVFALEVYSDLYVHSLDYDNALSKAEDAERISAKLVEKDPDNPNWLRLVYSAAWRTGYIMWRLPGYTEAQERKEYEIALKSLEKASSLATSNFDWRLERAFMLGRIGELLAAHNDNVVESLKYDQQSLEIMAELAKEDPQKEEFRRELASAQQRVGWNLLRPRTATFDQGVQFLHSALQIREKLVNDYPDHDGYISNLISSHGDLARIAELQGKLEDAMEARRWVIDHQKALAEKAPDNATWWNYLAQQLARAIGTLKKECQDLPCDEARRRQGDDEIRADYLQELAARRILAERQSSGIVDQARLAKVAEEFAEFLSSREQLGEALTEYRAALEAREKIARASPDTSRDAASLDVTIGDLLLKLSQDGSPDAVRSARAEALDCYQKALDALARVSPNGRTKPEWQALNSAAAEKVQALAARVAPTPVAQ